MQFLICLIFLVNGKRGSPERVYVAYNPRIFQGAMMIMTPKLRPLFGTTPPFY